MAIEAPVRRRSPRARPLPPDERRAALVATTLRLVLANGTDVTTRQIADACGVAEGTIFRVFPDKDALIRATLEVAMDQAPLLAELAAVDRTLPLRPRLTRLTTILQQHFMTVVNLLLVAQLHGPPADVETRRRANSLTGAAVARLLRPDADRFRRPPAEVARLLRMLIFSGSHPVIADGNPLSVDEIVDLLLDGVLRDQSGDSPDCGDLRYSGGQPC